MKAICFYHKADLDGVCSAAIVKHFVPDCELYGIDYGDEFPWALLNCPECGGFGGVVVGQNPNNGEAVIDQCPRCVTYADCAETRRTVYMVDFSLKPDGMKRLAEVSDLVWLDHHKTCEALWNEINPLGMFRTNYAACELTWVWLALHVRGSHKPRQLTNDLKTGVWLELVPEAVRLLGRYDIWDKDNPEWESRILPFQYGCRTLSGIMDPCDPVWERMLGLSQSDILPRDKGGACILDLGDAVIRFQATQNQRIAEAGAFVRVLTKFQPTMLPEPVWSTEEIYRDTTLKPLDRLRCICLNTPLYNSSSFDGVWDPEKYDVMVAFAMMASGKWKVSLYSTKDTVDCGAICKTFGGGGHKGAAGFTCDTLPWDM